MNFYSFDNSDIKNNLFQDNQLYEKFDSDMDRIRQNDNNNLDIDEKFAGVPTTSSIATDSQFQCSDSYIISGDNHGSTIIDTSLDNCKELCNKSGGDCVGFNYDKNVGKCTLKKNVEYMPLSNNNNLLCVKKSSSSDLSCSYNNNDNNNDNTSITKDEIKTEKIQNESNYFAEMEYKPVNNRTIKKTLTKPSIYVDLNCFLKNIEVLKNHSENTLIDLELLTSNIKSCSYIKKKPNLFFDETQSNVRTGETDELIDKITSKIEIPQPSTVKLYNVPANVLMASEPKQMGSIIDVEPFENSNKSNYNDNIKIVILVILLVYIMIIRIQK